jgi:hypothetical protein
VKGVGLWDTTQFPACLCEEVTLSGKGTVEQDKPSL